MLFFTPCERAALQLPAAGKNPAEIAHRLGIGEPAVEAHLASLFAKMGAASRSEAIAAAARRGLLSNDRQRSQPLLFLHVPQPTSCPAVTGQRSVRR